MGWEGSLSVLQNPWLGIMLDPVCSASPGRLLQFRVDFLACLIAVVCAPSLFGRGTQLEPISHWQVSKYCSSEKECLLGELNLSGISPCFFSSVPRCEHLD